MCKFGFNRNTPFAYYKNMAIRHPFNRILSPPGDQPGGGKSDFASLNNSTFHNANFREQNEILEPEFPAPTRANTGEGDRSDTVKPSETKAANAAESDQTTLATPGATAGDKGFQPITAVAKKYLEGNPTTEAPKSLDASKSPEGIKLANPQPLLSNQGLAAKASEYLAAPETPRAAIPAVSAKTEQQPSSQTQGVTEQVKPLEAPSTQAKSAPQGDAGASIPLVSGAAASSLVTALNRDLPHPDQGKVANVADAAKGALAAPEGKNSAAAEQPKPANLVGDSARVTDSTPTSRAASPDAHGGYKSDFGNRAPVDNRTAASKLPHGLEGKANVDKITDAKAPLAGARNPVAGLLPNGELKGIRGKLSTIDGFIGKSDKDARGARRSEGAETKTGNRGDGKSDSKLEGKQDGKLGARPGDKAGDKGAGGSPLSGKNALLNNLTDKITERINKSGEKPGEKTNAALTDRGVRSGDKAGLSPSEKLTDKSARPGDKPGNPLTDKPGDKPGTTVPDKNSKLGDKSGLSISGKSSDKTQVSNWDNSQAKAGDRSTVQPGDKGTKSTDRTIKGADRIVDGSRAQRVEQTISSRMMGVPILNNIAEHIMRLRPEPRAERGDSKQTQKSTASGPRFNFVLKDIEIKQVSTDKRQNTPGPKNDAPTSKIDGSSRTPADAPKPSKADTSARPNATDAGRPKIDNVRPPAAGSERVVKAEWGKVPELSPQFDTGRLIPLLLPTGLKGIKIAAQVENTTIIKDDGAPTVRVARPVIRLHLPDGTYGGEKVIPGHRVPRFEESKAQEAATVPLKVWSDKAQPAAIKEPVETNHKSGQQSESATVSPAASPKSDLHPDSPKEPSDANSKASDQSDSSPNRKRYVNPAIDALEETLSEEDDEKQSTNNTAELLLGASSRSKYVYTVKAGDTAESVALAELQDSNLAPLIIRKNTRYVLPAPAVGITPLREGAKIALPNPAEIAAYRRAAQ